MRMLRRMCGVTKRDWIRIIEKGRKRKQGNVKHSPGNKVEVVLAYDANRRALCRKEG